MDASKIERSEVQVIDELVGMRLKGSLSRFLRGLATRFETEPGSALQFLDGLSVSLEAPVPVGAGAQVIEPVIGAGAMVPGSDEWVTREQAAAAAGVPKSTIGSAWAKKHKIRYKKDGNKNVYSSADLATKLTVG